MGPAAHLSLSLPIHLRPGPARGPAWPWPAHARLPTGATPPTHASKRGPFVSMTIRRGRPPVRPSTPRGAPGPGRVLAAYLAAAFLLLAVVFALRPAQGPAPAAPTWDYQRETVALEGGGALNAYARWAVRTTAAVTRGSIERQRDVHRLSPLDFQAGEDAARALAGWRERHRLPLEGATLAAAVALAAWGTLGRRPGRLWL